MLLGSSPSYAPPLYLRSSSVPKSVKKRFYNEGSSSLVRRKSEGTAKTYIRQNEKTSVFLGEERKSLYLCHRKDKRQKAKDLCPLTLDL